MKELTFRKDLLPDPARPDAHLVLFSEWYVASSEQQRKVVDAAMQVWEHFSWPEGLLSYSCFLGTDGQSILHYSQWTGPDAHQRFVQHDPPGRFKSIEQVTAIERHMLGKFWLYRSVATDTVATPGCFVLVAGNFESRHLAADFIDARCQDMESDQKAWSRCLAAHFHLDEEGTTMVNFAAWQREQDHEDSLRQPEKGVSPATKKAREGIPKPGTGRFKRYHFYRSIIQV